MKTLILKKIGIILGIILVLIFAMGFIIYQSIEPEYEIEGYDPEIGLPEGAVETIKIGNEGITTLLTNKDYEGTIIHTMSYNLNCAGGLNNDLFEYLNYNFPKIQLIPLSIDLNLKNMDKLMSLGFYDNEIPGTPYLLDYPFDFTDLKNENNTLKLYQFLTNRNDKDLQSYSFAYLFNNKGKLLEEFDDLDTTFVRNLIEKHFHK